MTLRSEYLLAAGRLFSQAESFLVAVQNRPWNAPAAQSRDFSDSLLKPLNGLDAPFKSPDWGIMLCHKQYALPFPEAFMALLADCTRLVTTAVSFSTIIKSTLLQPGDLGLERLTSSSSDSSLPSSASTSPSLANPMGSSASSVDSCDCPDDDLTHKRASGASSRQKRRGDTSYKVSVSGPTIT